MKRNIELATKIYKAQGNDWRDAMEELNILYIFEKIYNLEGVTRNDANVISAYIIFAYDNDSQWLNYQQDRDTNKERIMITLHGSTGGMFRDVIYNQNRDVNDCIAIYLQSQCTYQWNTAATYLDFAAEMLRVASQPPDDGRSVDRMTKDGERKITLITEYDAEKLTKININRSLLLTQAREARSKANEIIKEIEAEYLELNQAVKHDFGFEPASEKSIHHEKWRDFIRHSVVPSREAKKGKATA